MNPIMPAPRAEQSGTAIMHEYLGIAQRSKWLILGCIAVCVVLAWSYCLIATKYYRSEALLVVDEPKLLESVVQKSVEDKFEQQLFLVQRQIMSLNFLSSIAKEFNLYPELREEGDENAPVLMLAGSTLVERVKMDPSSWPHRRGGLYRVFHTSRSHDSDASDCPHRRQIHPGKQQGT